MSLYDATIRVVRANDEVDSPVIVDVHFAADGSIDSNYEALAQFLSRLQGWMDEDTVAVAMATMLGIRERRRALINRARDFTQAVALLHFDTLLGIADHPDGYSELELTIVRDELADREARRRMTPEQISTIERLLGKESFIPRNWTAQFDLADGWVAGWANNTYYGIAPDGSASS